MLLHDEIRGTKEAWPHLTFYEKFEQIVVLVLTALIAVVIASATWHLGVNIVHLLSSDVFNPADQAIFQTVFGMIFTVIIALEFKHSLLVVLARQESIVQVRSIVLLAMLAILRKFIILDLERTTSTQLFALAAATLALGIVYWLVRDQDRRERVETMVKTSRRELADRRAEERASMSRAEQGAGEMGTG